MGNVVLFLSGAVLFLNSLLLLGKAEEKSVAIFNVFIGTIQIIMPIYFIATTDQSNWVFYNTVPIFLFGLTYLYFGVTVLKELESSGLGWFCLWVTIIAVVYSFIAIIHFHNFVDGLTWAMWALLWFLFFLSNTLKKKIDAFIGIVAFIESWVTLTIPALLFFTGVWNNATVQQVWSYVLILSIVLFGISLFTFSEKNRSKETNADIQTI